MKPIKKTYLVTVRVETERTVSKRRLVAVMRRDRPYVSVSVYSDDGEASIKSGKVVAIEEE